METSRLQSSIELRLTLEDNIFEMKLSEGRYFDKEKMVSGDEVEQKRKRRGIFGEEKSFSGQGKKMTVKVETSERLVPNAMDLTSPTK